MKTSENEYTNKNAKHSFSSRGLSKLHVPTLTANWVVRSYLKLSYALLFDVPSIAFQRPRNILCHCDCVFMGCAGPEDYGVAVPWHSCVYRDMQSQSGWSYERHTTVLIAGPSSLVFFLPYFTHFTFIPNASHKILLYTHRTIFTWKAGEFAWPCYLIYPKIIRVYRDTSIKI